MKPLYLRYSAAAVTAALGLPAMAAGITVGVEVPRLQVAEYHRPYVAVWIERADSSVASTLAVWYDIKLKNAEGTKWLKDMRQWWRCTGRELDFPIDGVTSPTRPAGSHSMEFTEGQAPFTALPPGEYKLMVEAAREVGGRELVSIPFSWPAKASTELKAQGNAELGAISLQLKP